MIRRPLSRWAVSMALVLVTCFPVARADTAWEAFAKYEWPRLLGEDPKPGYALVAAFVTTLPDVQAWRPGQFYERALAESPGDPVTLYSLATWCFYSPNQVICAGGDVLQALADADPDNGVPLMMLAVRELVRNEDANALALLEAAAGKARLDGYWGPMVGLLRATISETVPEAMGEPMTLATGLVAARPLIEANVHDVCTSAAAKLLDREWNRVCLLLGQALEERATTLLMAQMGVAIQKRMLKLHDDEEQLAALEARIAAMEELDNIDGLSGEALENFWADLERVGEMEALRRAASNASQ